MKGVTGGKFSTFALGLAAVTLLSGMALAVYSPIPLARSAKVETRRAVLIYAAGQTLFPGTHVRLIDLAGALARLGYVETRPLPTARGQFRRTAGAWDISLRDGRGRVRLQVRGERIERVMREGKEEVRVVLEREVVAGGGEQGGGGGGLDKLV